MSRKRIEEIDFLSRRYAKLPSEIKDLSMSDYQFNQFIAFSAAQSEIKSTEKKTVSSDKRKSKVTLNQVSG